MLQKILYRLFGYRLFAGLCLWGTGTAPLYAAPPSTPSLGDVSGNILDILSGVNDAAYSICYALGVVLIGSAAILYRRHRQSPTEIRLSHVFLVLILGLIVGGLPFFVRMSDAGQILTGILL